MNIEFVTNNSLALDYAPIPAKKMLPDWYKNLSDHCVDKEYINDAYYHHVNEISSTKTIRGCVPVLDYLTSGYIIRAHSQLLITPKLIDVDLESFWWKSSNTVLDTHNHIQCPIKIDGVKKTYMKYENCWGIKLPKGYSCLFYQPHYFLEKRFVLFPAIVDCDEYNNPVSFSGYMSSKESFYINPGDPIVAVFPFKRDDWTSNARLLTEEEQKRPNKLMHYLHTRYKKVFHKKKSYK
jgi:hypothetical protein